MPAAISLLDIRVRVREAGPCALSRPYLLAFRLPPISPMHFSAAGQLIAFAEKPWRSRFRPCSFLSRRLLLIKASLVARFSCLRASRPKRHEFRSEPHSQRSGFDGGTARFSAILIAAYFAGAFRRHGLADARPSMPSFMCAGAGLCRWAPRDERRFYTSPTDYEAMKSSSRVLQVRRGAPIGQKKGKRQEGGAPYSHYIADWLRRVRRRHFYATILTLLLSAFSFLPHHSGARRAAYFEWPRPPRFRTRARGRAGERRFRLSTRAASFRSRCEPRLRCARRLHHLYGCIPYGHYGRHMTAPAFAKRFRALGQ